MDYSKERLRKIFSGTDADAVVLVNGETQDPNFAYLTGFTSGTFESNVLIAKRDGMLLVTNSLEYDTAMAQKPSNMKVFSSTKSRPLAKILKEELDGGTLGFNGSFLNYSTYTRLKEIVKPRKLVDFSESLGEARVVKLPDEIAKIRKANRITRIAFSEIEDSFKVGVTEQQIAAKFDYIMGSNGSSGLAFPTIVAFGANSALPHHFPGGTKLRPNSFVLIDAGARYQNYCADMTRTFIFKPDRKLKDYGKMAEMMRIVKEAQSAANSKIRAGVMGCVPHNTAAKLIDTSAGGAYRGRFIHGLGHSLGIEVHDGAIGFSPGVKTRLKENMVITNEPGIYVVGFGGVRMEDDTIVKKGGVEVI